MKTVAVLAYPDCQILDVTGPLQVFASANTELGQAVYRVQVIGLTKEPVVTNSGMRLMPDYAYADSHALDTLLIAGGRGVQELRKRTELIHWIRQQATHVRRLGSVCSGAFMLAEAGLLEGKEVVSHWRCCDSLANDYPDLDVNPDAIWIKQGSLYTSAGVTSGIDLALALVEEDYGHTIAMGVARDLVVYMKRPGGQAQFSVPLQAQREIHGPVSKAVSFIEANLNCDLSIGALADYCAVSERHLSRLFKQHFSSSPAAFVEQRRFYLAQGLLADGASSLQKVAEQSGFVSADNLRRVFLKRIGINPSEYRKRFGRF